MADTYATIAEMAAADAFLQRCAACAAQQGEANPWEWAYQARYTLCSSPGWAAAVDSWKAGNPGQGTGWETDQAVISDAMILATVQPMIGP